jgi:hypothetical protein
VDTLYTYTRPIRFVTYASDDQWRAGILLGDRVLDAEAAAREARIGAVDGAYHRHRHAGRRGHGSDPKVWLRDGDLVEIEIDGIGTLRNRVTREA